MVHCIIPHSEDSIHKDSPIMAKTNKKRIHNESAYQTGNVLLSQAASHQVSSALRSLTTVFEMGTGVSSLL